MAVEIRKLSIKLLLLLPVVFLISSCGKKDNDDSPYIDEVIVDNRSEADKLIDGINLSCENPASCPEYVGGLVSISQSYEKKSYYDLYPSLYQKLGFCSLTLIAPNKVLTNRHCLPSNLQYKGAICSNIVAVFPASKNRPLAKAYCKSVTDLSDLYDEKFSGPLPYLPDWTILELVENIDRSPISINTSGVEDNTALNLYPVYYRHAEYNYGGISQIVGVIKEVPCKSNMTNFLSFRYNNPNDPVLTLNCDANIIKGNSGSGMISEKGELKGVVSAGADKNQTIDFMGKKSKPLKREVVSGSNAHCIPEFETSRSQACDFEKSFDMAIQQGSLLTLMLGQKASLDEIEKVKQILDSDMGISWEKLNLSVLSDLLDSNQYKSSNSSDDDFVKQYVVAKSIEKSLPVSPVCIRSSKMSERSFKFKWPILVPLESETSLSQNFSVSTPLVARYLEFDMRYNKKDSVFMGKLSRLPKAERNLYIEKIKNNSKAFLNCYMYGKTNMCDTFYRLFEDLRTRVSTSKFDTALYMNEYFLNTWVGASDKLELPLCE